MWAGTDSQDSHKPMAKTQRVNLFLFFSLNWGIPKASSGQRLTHKHCYAQPMPEDHWLFFTLAYQELFPAARSLEWFTILLDSLLLLTHCFQNKAVHQTSEIASFFNVPVFLPIDLSSTHCNTITLLMLPYHCSKSVSNMLLNREENILGFF